MSQAACLALASKPPGISDDVWHDALWRFWASELEATIEHGHTPLPDWRKRRIAAFELCRLIGLDQIVRAISADGALRPPPQWPEVDCVPVGGGPGMILCDVRTRYNGQKKSVRIGLVKPPHMRSAKQFDRSQIGEAIERGRFELKRKLGA